jgi:two-component system OmpR family sensor kinase
MFTSFARRLTAWYVAAAVGLVAIVLGAFSVGALYLYVHLLQDNVDATSREAQSLALRASARGQTFASAASEFERRSHMAGVRVVGIGPFGPPQSTAGHASATPLLIRTAPRDPTLMRPSPVGARAHGPRAGTPPPAPDIFINSQLVHGDPRLLSFGGSRLGFAIGTAFGTHLSRVDFDGGELRLLPDPDAIGVVAFWLLGAIVCVAAAAGILAWFSGRYITTQVLRPLVEVTQALQRFAARDFSQRPIAVAGKSEFDAIALAYNAASAQVAAAFEERQQAEVQMRQFVADAGHELRTPLTIVLGYIDLLKRKADEGDERSRRIFASIALEGARMRTLIDNLVLLARMEGDDVRPAEPFALRPLLDDIIDARRLLVHDLKIDLTLDVDATVIGRRDEIHEAVANIIDNAIKYAPGTPIAVRVRGLGSGVEIAISDKGPGIHPDDRAAIFDRFYRGSTRGDIEGSGLGLAIAKRAVERAGGTLTLAKSSPTGTTFVLRLRSDRTTAARPIPVSVEA